MTDLLYKSEHLSCINYEHNSGTRILEREIDLGNTVLIAAQVNKIVIVIENVVSISSDTISPTLVKKNSMFFLSAGKSIEISTRNKEAKVLIISLFDRINLCDTLSLDELIEGQNSTNTSVTEFHLLKMNSVVKAYLDLLLHCHRLGLRCCNYNKGKITELFFILRAFYPKEELFAFFASAISADTEFLQQVMHNHLSCWSVAELALKTGYTTSGFEKKFKRVFQETPYRWMTKQKKREIFHVINQTSMSITQISDLFGFSSTSNFNDYVKRNFGKPPGQLRIGGIKDN